MSPLLDSYLYQTNTVIGIGLAEHGRFLIDVYKKIVRPMTKHIKELMVDYKLINEAEMFCTDLEFRADDQGNITDYIGDLAKKNDDVIKAIQERLRELVSGLGKDEGGFK